MVEILLRLAAKLTVMAFYLLSRVMLLLLEHALQLLHWSVRTYGWGRVGSLLLALTFSLWAHLALGATALGGSMLVSLMMSTLLLWGGGWWLVQNPERVGSLLRPLRVAGYAARPLPVLQRPPPEGGSLWEELVCRDTLLRAWQGVTSKGGAPGPDRVTVEGFGVDLERNLSALEQDLRSGRYRPGPPRRVEVAKRDGGSRQLSILNVRDRIVQLALAQVLAPQWNPHFAACSYAYRPRRSALQAANVVAQGLEQGRVWALDGDIRSFFDRISHRRLFDLLDQWLPDPKVRWLLERGVRAASVESGRGVPQGAATSPVLSNLFLHAFDETLLRAGYDLVRYADDFVILCATRPQAEEALKVTERTLRSMDLSLHPEKTRIVHRDQGFTFLGFHFSAEGMRPSDEAVRSLEERLARAPDPRARAQVETGWRNYFGRAGRDDSADTGEATGEEARASEGNEPWTSEDVMDWTDALSPDSEAETPSSQPAGSRLPASGVLETYRRRFLGRQDLFARQWEGSDGRHGYLPVRRSAADDDLKEHLNGTAVLGTYPLSPGGTTSTVVFDVDGPSLDEPGREQAHRLAMRLLEALLAGEVPALLFDSGGKGRHIWLCLSAPMRARDARQWAQGFLDRFRPFSEGVLVEVFPKQDFLRGHALGALIRLPLGRHPRTRRESRLLDEHGRPVADPWPVLARHPLVDPSSLSPGDSRTASREQSASHRSDGDLLSPRSSPELPDPPRDVAPLLQGCDLLRALVDKAAQTGHLRHTENLSLLYTLGHCGDSGRAYLHQVIALCDNYSPRIVQGWIQRLDEGHRPLSCTRLHEWLRDHLPGLQCSGCAARRRSSPVDLLRKAHRPDPNQRLPQHAGADEDPPTENSEGVMEDFLDFADGGDAPSAAREETHGLDPEENEQETGAREHGEADPEWQAVLSDLLLEPDDEPEAEER